MRSVRYGCIRTRSHSPAPSGPRLSQIAFETPSRPRSCTRPARRSVRTSSVGEPEPRAAASAASSRDRPRVAERVRRLQIDEVRDRQQRRVEPLAREHDGERRLGVDHRVPGLDRVEAREDHLGLGAHQLGQRGIELLAGARRARAPSPPRRRRRGARPRRTPPAARAATAIGTSSPSSSPGQPRPSHGSYAAPSASSTGSGSPSCSPSVRAIAAWWAIMSSTSRWPESANSSADAEAVQRRVARSRAAASPAAAPHAAELVVVLARLQRDVVAEPLRLLVRVGVAADVDQQRRVVDDRPRAARRARPARRGAARSGTGAARAPSAARSRDRSRATAPRRAPPGGRARDRSPTPPARD